MSNPSINDVHVKGAIKIKKPTNKQYELKDVPVAIVGKWTDKNGNTVEFTSESLDQLVENTNKLIQDKEHEPPIKLGHDSNQTVKQLAGLPALGWINKLKRVGNRVLAEIKNIPELLYEAVQNKRYKKVSPEIYMDYSKVNSNGNIKGLVLKALSFLGADIPAQKGLGDILAMNENDTILLQFNEGDFEMKKVLSLAQVTKLCDFCGESMKSKNMTEIELSEFVKWFREDKAEDVIKRAELLLSENAPVYIFAEGMKPETWDEAIIKKANDMYIESGSPDVTGNPNQPPKEWFDKCVNSVSGKTQTPDKLCGWIYHNQMSPEAKAEVETMRASEPTAEELAKIEADKKAKADTEAKEKADAEAKALSEKQEKEKLELAEKERIAKIEQENKDLKSANTKKEVLSFMELHKDVFVPAIKDKVETYLLSNSDNVYMFNEKEVNGLELTLSVLSDVIDSTKRNVLMFTEIKTAIVPDTTKGSKDFNYGKEAVIGKDVHSKVLEYMEKNKIENTYTNYKNTLIELSLINNK